MATSEHNLNEALKRAALLMSPEGQRKIDLAGKQNNNSYSNEGDYIQQTPQRIRKNVNENFNNFSVKNNKCKLPKAIQESIIQNPITNTINEYSTESSILDSLMENNYQQSVQESYVYNQPSAPVYSQHVASPTTSIDYNYIKSIVNECIQANLQKIKEEILNESSLKTIRIANENKIQLIDNKNNLFESKLEFKKNITKK